MTAPQPVAQLPAAALPRLSATIAGVVPADSDRFLAALELGYLAASADGLDGAERGALAEVLERATRSKIDHATFEAHFYDLDAAVAMLGRRERLARTAADFASDDAREDAIRFAALVAMADGMLHESELGVLVEAATHFGWSAERVTGIVHDAVARVRGEP